MKIILAFMIVLVGCMVLGGQPRAQSVGPACDVLLKETEQNPKRHVGKRVDYFGSPVWSSMNVLLSGETTVMHGFDCMTPEGQFVPGGRFMFEESGIERGKRELDSATGKTLFRVSGVVKGATTIREQTGREFVLPRLEKVSLSVVRK